MKKKEDGDNDDDEDGIPSCFNDFAYLIMSNAIFSSLLETVGLTQERKRFADRDGAATFFLLLHRRKPALTAIAAAEAGSALLMKCSLHVI